MTLPAIDETHDPRRSSWVGSSKEHPDFPLQNLPYGVFTAAGAAPGVDAQGADAPRIGVAIGDEVLDLRACAEAGLVPAGLGEALLSDRLNALLALGSQDRRALRRRIFALLTEATHRAVVAPLLRRIEDCRLGLPARIGDYTDFYVGIHHATNVGRLFRPDTPLLPNYKYIPVGYHGRASSVRPSGVAVVRPSGQRKALSADAPVFGPTQRLDYELELGVWVGPGNALGTRIPIDDAAEHIAGFCLLNDWSARDLQTWEYQPLGPFLAKSFHTTISPWVVTAEALAPFRQAQPPRPAGDPRPLPYLWDDADQQGGALGLRLEVDLLSARMRARGLAPHRLSLSSAESMYWTVAQMVTHHASNGCNLGAGDLMGTGTLSGPEPGSYGSLLELTQGGTVRISLPTGETRGFVEDGDEIIFSAVARHPDYAPIGFGPCRAEVRPSEA